MRLVFAQNVFVNIPNINIYAKCKIVGKIKNSDIYLCSFTRHKHRELLILKETFGCPVRHMSLEWGNFGGEYEFFIPERFIEATHF